VPDGDTNTGTDPLPPADQVNLEISTGRVMEWLGGLFGTDWQTTAGGGGTGGQFMFANVAELDSVISQWKDQREAIYADGVKIRQAMDVIVAPAGDAMSGGMANSATTSLDVLFRHNQEMRKYADAYIQKLEASRMSMANTDLSGKTTIGNVY
jgi:hypothetical protein